MYSYIKNFLLDSILLIVLPYKLIKILCVCTRACVCVCMYVCMRASAHILIYTYIYVDMIIYSY